MNITFSPQRIDTALVASKVGDTLILNGVEFNFTNLPDGATLPEGAVKSEWIYGPVSRIDGDLHITLRLPHGPNPSQAVAFPEPIHVTEDGPIPLPTDEVSA